MKKNAILISMTLFFHLNSNSQITKGNWLVGGSGRFSSQSQSLNSSEVKGSNIEISPNIGYFFIDKFAGGARLSLNYSKVKFNGGVSEATQLGLGPFLRYYFLNADKRVNLFAESTYQYIHYSGNNGASDKQNTLHFSAGPVVYFNSIVGIEFTANYELVNSSDNTKAKIFSLGIGFQIHLEKENN